MTAQDLKNSILQRAMQGKLTKQLSSDCNVDEAIESMKRKRMLLIQSGKLRKEGKINNVTDKNELEIPSNWRFVLLKDVICKRVDNRGKTPEHEKIKKRGYIDLLEINSFVPGGYITHNNVEKFISKQVYESALRGYVEKDDILIATVGSIGKFSLMDDTCSAIAQNIIGIRCFEEIEQKYIFYLLQSPYFYTQMNCVTMEAVQASIKVPDLMNLRVPLPPIEEQRRIVAKIEELLPYVEKYGKAYDKLEQFNKKFPEDMRKSILQYAMQGKLVEQRAEEGSAEELLKIIDKQLHERAEEGFEKYHKVRDVDSDIEPFSIPDSWKWVYISDMSIFQEGPGILAVDFRSKGVPLIRIAGMQGDILSLDGCNYLDEDMVNNRWSHFRLDVGDIVISTSASMDKICEVDETTVGAIPYTGQIRFKMLGNISKEFFKWFIKSPCYMKQIDEQKKGGMIKHYGPSHLRKMVIPLPPLLEQHRIVEAIENLMPYCDMLK